MHATPGAKRNHVGGEHDGALRVCVTAVADRGKANKAIRKALADAFGLSVSQIELRQGTANRRKLFVVRSTNDSLQTQVELRKALG